MIKYIDKIQDIENKIFYSNIFRIASTSIIKLVDEIKNSKEYEEKKQYGNNFLIDIINTNVETKYLNSIISEDTKDLMIDMYDAKTMLSDIAYTRKIEISLNLDEICTEKMEVFIDPSRTDCNTFCFDYGLMYGNRVYNKNDYVELKRPYTERFLITNINLPNNKFKISELYKSSNCAYYGDIYNYNDYYEGSCPIATALLGNIINSKDSNEYNIEIKILALEPSFNVIDKCYTAHAVNKEEAMNIVKKKESEIRLQHAAKNILIKITNINNDNDTTGWVEFNCNDLYNGFKYLYPYYTDKRYTL